MYTPADALTVPTPTPPPPLQKKNPKMFLIMNECTNKLTDRQMERQKLYTPWHKCWG